MPRAATVQEEARQQGVYLDPLAGLPRPMTIHSVRRLGSWYYGPLLRVRRSSDDAESDIWPTAVGDLDVAALARHCGSGSGFVTTQYDLSGRGHHLVQATAGAQPAIYIDGVVQHREGRAGPSYQGTDDRMRATIAMTGTVAEATCCTVAWIATACPNGSAIQGWSGVGATADRTYGNDLSISNGRIYYYAAALVAGSNATEVETGTTTHWARDEITVMASTWTASANESTGFHVNGQRITGLAGARTFGGNGNSLIQVGHNVDGSYFIGSILETIQWGEALSVAHRRTVSRDQAAYYRSRKPVA